MPTYNRVTRVGGVYDSILLNEAVYSFLRQDYAHKELIIINDTPGQTLQFDHPDVRVLNYPERFASLGEKCNAAIAQATGEYITRWDDDDISLPWRLAGCAMELLHHRKPHCLVVGGYWFNDLHRGLFEPKLGAYGFNQDWYYRETALTHPYEASSNGEDQAFRRDFVQDAKLRVATYHPTLEELHYIYRWRGHGHLSVARHVGESRYAEIGRQSITQVESYELTPMWYAAYEDIRLKALEDLKA